MHGIQTAVVTGPSGEDIHTDEYARIRVRFFWEREGMDSLWARVSQPWAGKTWGVQFIPRIGMEVVVDFLEGDPDRPVIVGTVYNADNMPPYTLTGQQDPERLEDAQHHGRRRLQLQRAALRGQEGLGGGLFPRREGLQAGRREQ